MHPQAPQDSVTLEQQEDLLRQGTGALPLRRQPQFNPHHTTTLNSPQPSPRSPSPSMNGQPPSRNSSYSDLEENDDTGIISRRIPGRAAPPPPPSMYKY